MSEMKRFGDAQGDAAGDTFAFGIGQCEMSVLVGRTVAMVAM